MAPLTVILRGGTIGGGASPARSTEAKIGDGRADNKVGRLIVVGARTALRWKAVQSAGSAKTTFKTADITSV